MHKRTWSTCTCVDWWCTQKLFHTHSTSTSVQLKRYLHYVFKINLYCFFVMQCEVDWLRWEIARIFSLSETHSIEFGTHFYSRENRAESCQFLGCQYWLMTLFRIALNSTQFNNGKWFSEKNAFVIFIPSDPNTREIAINERMMWMAKIIGPCRRRSEKKTIAFAKLRISNI